MSKQIKSNAGSRGYTGALGKITFLAAFVLSLAGCGGGGSGSAGGGGCNLTIQEIEAIGNINDLPAACLALLPVPENNLLGRMFILGTQKESLEGVDVLNIFVTGTDSDGNPIILTDFHDATVTIDAGLITEVVHQADPPALPNPTSLVTVEPVADGDKILSVGFATDYSASISDPELSAISGVFSTILTELSPPNLPDGGVLGIFEGMLINFANTVVVQEDWTDDAGVLDMAFDVDPGLDRNGTAFFDALGVALRRDLDLSEDSLGLVERCRPAHLQIAFTDGIDNASMVTEKEDLIPIIDNSSAVMIMLGSLNADKDLLVELAGDRGAFAYAYDLTSIQETVTDWAISLSHMVKFTLDQATLFTTADTITITIDLGSEILTAEVVRPEDGFCEVAPVI